jgi:dCMP deaminase
MRSFDTSYLKIARVWGENSRARRAKVGAIIVKDNMIISDGFNGTPSGFENDCEEVVGCDVHKDITPGQKCAQEHTIPTSTCLDSSYSNVCRKLAYYNFPNDCINCKHAVLKTKAYVLHAEANAITKLAKSGNSSDGATLYVTMSPCVECAKLIIQSGIKRVVYEDEYRDTTGLELLKRAGIAVEKMDVK